MSVGKARYGPGPVDGNTVYEDSYTEANAALHDVSLQISVFSQADVGRFMRGKMIPYDEVLWPRGPGGAHLRCVSTFVAQEKS